MKHPIYLPLAAAVLALAATPGYASTAYGDLNNFDVVNDTGQEGHGFEIELDDIHSTDVTYTFDWNHYGAPKITEDNSDPAHPKVFVRYEAKYDAATSTFSAFTAVPAAPLAPTNGHMCTNISVNEGCEHFGVGYYGAPTVVRYNWLIENPTAPGTLIHGPAVNVATPTFTYAAPVNAQPAQVVAAIQAPPPPPPEVVPPAALPKFGEAVWAKEIKTSSKNNQAVKLADLVSDDPNDPNDKNWLNDKPDDGIVVQPEVEIEWRLMQTEFAKLNDPANPGGANGQLAAAPEDLPNGDEIVTRRYEFYKYSGNALSFDGETHEAMCDKVAADGTHGVGTVRVTDVNGGSYDWDCSADTVVGEYIGAQMAGFNVAAVLGLIDHVQDGDLNQAYTSRTVVVGGNSPYNTTLASGALPQGLSIDSQTGVLSGTPTAAGSFSFTVDATDADGVHISKAYTMKVVDPAAPNGQQYRLAVARSGSGTGSVAGNGIDCGATCSVTLDQATQVALTATPVAGSLFAGWSGCDSVANNTCNLALNSDTTVTATFNPQQYQLSVGKSGNGSGTVTGNGINCGATCSVNLSYGTAVSLTASPAVGSTFTGWSGACTGTGACSTTMDATKSVTATFASSTYALSVSLSGTAGAGKVTSSPAGIDCGTICQAQYAPGTLVTLTASAVKGRRFAGWSGACTGSKSCKVTMSQSRSVTATFK